MAKKHIVRLIRGEREHVSEVTNKLKGGSQKVKRAWILLRLDANGDGWPDEKIAEAYSCQLSTV